MKVLYTVSVERRHAPETELLTRLIEDAVKSFNLLMLTKSRIEEVRMVADQFHEVRRGPNYGRARHRYSS